MGVFHSHDTEADDEDAEAESEPPVTIVEGHAVQFNEYRY